MDRQHRRDLKHDRFVDEIGILSRGAQANQRLIVAIALAAVVLAVLGYGIYYYRNSREAKAQTALSEAIDTINSPLVPAAGQPPVTGAKFKTDAEKNAAAQKQFATVESNFRGTDAADVAKLYLARLDAGRGDATTARRLLQEFVNDHPKHLLVGSARYSIYQLRIEHGEAPQVVTEVNAELAKPEPVLPADALLVVLAHAYDAQGQADKSREAYRRIATEFPDSPYALEAQRHVGPA
jgi:TolA-binding protein